MLLHKKPFTMYLFPKMYINTPRENFGSHRRYPRITSGIIKHLSNTTYTDFKEHFWSHYLFERPFNISFKKAFCSKSIIKSNRSSKLNQKSKNEILVDLPNKNILKKNKKYSPKYS